MSKVKNLSSKYSIVYDKKKKEWNLKSRGNTILSGDKSACKAFFNYIMSMNG